MVKPVFIFDHKYFFLNPGVTALREGVGGLVNSGFTNPYPSTCANGLVNPGNTTPEDVYKVYYFFYL